MKRLYFLVMLALMANKMAMANEYNVSAQDGNVLSDASSSSDKRDLIGGIFLVYYGFDGFCNYGVSDYFLKPNGVSGEFNLRTQFKQYSNYNVDLGINYSFLLWEQDKATLLLTLAAGPSFRMQNVSQIEYNERTGKTTEESKEKFYIDGFVNPRLTLQVGKVILSAGYFYWAPQFKFSKDDGATGGFNVGIAYNF